MQPFRVTTITAMALLLAAPGSFAQEAEQATEPLDIEGEDLVDDPAHGMGQGDPAIASGNDLHSIDGQRGYIGLDDAQQQEVGLIESTGLVDIGGWTPDDLVGATVVTADGKALGEIADLLLDGEMLVRHALLELPGDGGHVAIRVEDLTQENSGEFVLDGSVINDDGTPQGDRYEANGDRWVPAEV